MYEKIKHESVKLSFSNEDDFMEFEDYLESETSWHRSSDEFTVEVLDTSYVYPKSCVTGEEEFEKGCMMGSFLTCFTDALSGSKITALLNKVTTPFSLNERAGVKCLLSQVYLERSPEKYAQLINDGLCAVGGDLTVLIRGGQVLAVHSGKYKTLSQKEIFKEIKTLMPMTFPEAKFIGAFYEHDFTRADYSISDGSSEIMEGYKKAWISSGNNPKILEKTSPVISISTSDTGRYTLSLMPNLKIGSYYYPLGTEVKMKHIGDSALSVLPNKLKLCFSALQGSIEAIEKMQKIKLTHPYSVFVKAVKEIGLDKKAKNLAKECLEGFKESYEGDEESITAFTIYREICDSQLLSSYKKLSNATQLQVYECFSRLLVLDYEKLDFAGIESI